MAKPKVTQKKAPQPRKDQTKLLAKIAKDNEDLKKTSQKKKKPFNPPAAPKGLDTDGKLIWRRVCKMMHEAGTYDDKYQWAIQTYCQAYSDYKRISEKLVQMRKDDPEQDLVLKGGRGGAGGMYRNPWFDVQMKCVQLGKEFWVLLGLTPIDNMRLTGVAKGKGDGKATGGKDDSNPFSRFL
jgi:P27 family predicted phage terminase small subunit